VREIAFNDKERMVAVLANQALNFGGGSSSFFKNLILQLNLPLQVTMSRVGALQGSPEPDARNLITWAAVFGINPNDHVPTLGSIALSLLPLSGAEDAAMLAAIVVYYRLVPQDKLDALRIKFQIPRPLAETERSPSAAHGPQFDWNGPTEELKLESFLYPAVPEFLEVSLLESALDRARSVCRVEVSSTGEVGTGVLISGDLVLTNYHVLTTRPDDLLTNAKSTILRFGAFRAQEPGSTVADGQVVKLDASEPVVEASPVSEYDFVLLRTDGSKAQDIIPAPFVSLLPVPDSAIHILQHPQAGPMMLALSKNGVTNVNAGSGKIQYVTRSAGGSSGSPCFNEQWNLVALHHAEVPKPFGSVREGILMKSILGRIQRHLSATSP
jgi:V8-like Glu-specific endopeptidase